MSKAIIQTVNSGDQTIEENGIIGLGTTTHRYGCDLIQNGNGIMVTGDGYYKIDANVVITPVATGDTTIVLLDNGTPIPGATASYTIETVGNVVTLPISFIIRRGCHCINADNISLQLTANSGTVNNIVVNIERK